MLIHRQLASVGISIGSLFPGLDATAAMLNQQMSDALSR